MLGCESPIYLPDECHWNAHVKHGYMVILD